MQTHYRFQDSTLIIKTSLFGLIKPKKVQFNEFNAVLISEVQMDSINLKYLRFNLLYSTTASFKLKYELLFQKFEKVNLQVDFLKNDNEALQMINTNNNSFILNTDKIHKNEILYWTKKAKGKFKVFLLGTSIGILIAFLLTSI